MTTKYDHRRARALRNELERAMHAERPPTNEDLDAAGVRPGDRELIRSEAGKLREMFQSGARGPARERAAVVASELANRGQLDQPAAAEDDARADAARVRR